MSNCIINPYVFGGGADPYCNEVSGGQLHHTNFVRNTAQNILGIEIESGHALVDVEITSITFYCMTSNSSSTDTFKYGVWEKSSNYILP